MNVGQHLYFVSSTRYGKSEDVTVTKVGRKWAELSNGHRIDMETMHADGRGYMSPGAAYHSKELYEEDLQRHAEWSEFRKSIDMVYTPPEFLGLSEIRRLRGMLKRP